MENNNKLEAYTFFEKSYFDAYGNGNDLLITLISNELVKIVNENPFEGIYPQHFENVLYLIATYFFNKFAFDKAVPIATKIIDLNEKRFPVSQGYVNEAKELLQKIIREKERGIK